MKIRLTPSVKIIRYALAIVMLLISAVVLFYVVEGYRGAKKLEQAQALLTEKGEPFTVEQMIPPMIPDATNLAMHPLFKNLDWEGQGLGTSDSFKFPDEIHNVKQPVWHKEMSVEELLLAWSDYAKAYFQDKHSMGTYAAYQDADLILKLLEEVPLDELKQAIHHRPDIRWPIAYEKIFSAPLPHLNPALDAGKLFNLRALVYAQQGETDKALNEIEAMLRLSQAVSQDGFMIGALLRLGIDNLAMKTLTLHLSNRQMTETQLDRVQELLLKMDILSCLQSGWRWERAGFSSFVLSSGYEDLLLAMQLNDPSLDTGLNWLWFKLYPDGWRDADVAFYYDFSQSYIIDSINRSRGFMDINRLKEGDIYVQNTFEESSLFHLYSGMALPSLMGAFKNTGWALAQRNALIAACQIEKYRLEHRKLPDDLDSMNLIRDRVVDPANGEPLRYVKKSDASYVIYSVGWNLKDDGGDSGSGKNSKSNAPDWVLEVSAAAEK